MIATTALPSDQRNDSIIIKASPAVEATELLLFKAAVATFLERQAEVEQEWSQQDGDLNKLYGIARSLKLPVSHRVASGNSGQEARGQCFGLSVTASGKAIVAASSQRSIQLVKMVREQVARVDAEFRFTSLRVVLNTRAQIHTDRNNQGNSMSVSMGPCTGGAFCIFDSTAGHNLVLEPCQGNSIDGRMPHFVLPFCGQ